MTLVTVKLVVELAYLFRAHPHFPVNTSHPVCLPCLRRRACTLTYPTRLLHTRTHTPISRTHITRTPNGPAKNRLKQKALMILRQKKQYVTTLFYSVVAGDKALSMTCIPHIPHSFFTLA